MPNGVPNPEAVAKALKRVGKRTARIQDRVAKGERQKAALKANLAEQRKAAAKRRTEVHTRLRGVLRKPPAAPADPSPAVQVEVIQPKIEQRQQVWRPYQERWMRDESRLAIAVKAAQIGFSTAAASWAIGRCLTRERHLVVILSASVKQAKELLNKAKAMVDAIAGVETHLSEGRKVIDGTEVLETIIKFTNGSRIIAVAAKPETARSYSGDIILDEFAFAQRSHEIFTAAYRQITLGGYMMRVISTPNGQQGKFWELAKDLGLDIGSAPMMQPVRRGEWSGHWCDIHMAARDGFPVNPETIRAGCDDLTWQQEYCCIFLAQSMLWLTPDLVAAACDEGALMGPPPSYISGLYAGWDFARTRDHSVLWFVQAMGDVTWCRGVVNISGMDTPTQMQMIRTWMPQVARLNIDMTGMGLPLHDFAVREWPTKVGGVQFTAPIKEQMAVHTRLRLEQRKMRIPDDETVRASFLSLRRSANKIGQTRFDADHDERYGHADYFWAASMAEQAALDAVRVETGPGGQGGNFRFDSRQASASPLANFMSKVL